MNIIWAMGTGGEIGYKYSYFIKFYSKVTDTARQIFTNVNTFE